MYPPYPFYPPQQNQPQIIMMPQYQQPQPPSIDNNNQQIKYLEKMMELKND